MTSPDLTDVLDGWGGNISLHRTAAGLTQEDLAKRMGVALRTVARWEAGDRRPNELDQRRIADVLGQHIARLFPRNDHERNDHEAAS